MCANNVTDEDKLLLKDFTNRIGQRSPHGSILVLDIGCGDGKYGLAIGYEGNTKVVCVDLSIQEIKKGLAKDSCKKVSFVVCDANRLPFKSAIFNGIMANSLLHHLPSFHSIVKVLREANRVLKNDGILLISELTPLNNPLDFLFRKAWGIVPFYFKRKLLIKKIDPALRDLKGPKTLLFTAHILRTYLDNAGFRVIEEKRRHLIGPLIYLTAIFPQLNPLLTKLPKVKMPTSFRRFCGVVNFYCIKIGDKNE